MMSKAHPYPQAVYNGGILKSTTKNENLEYARNRVWKSREESLPLREREEEEEYFMEE